MTGACEPSPFSHHPGVSLHLKLHFRVFEVRLSSFQSWILASFPLLVCGHGPQELGLTLLMTEHGFREALWAAL